MKHFFLYTFLLLLLSQTITVSAQSKKRVLFLGNSYTSVNNLPQIIADAALSVNDTLIFDSNTPGGHTLLQHSANTISQSKIMAGGWHYVIMQGQSQEPITAENNFYDGAENLNTLIKQYNPCSTPLFYMTWGRKNGDAINCPIIPVMCTYEGMDTMIKNVYLSVSEYLRAEVSTVSVVWKYLRKNYPTINLYHADESHPSAEGSYAAACCFYAAIFKKDPTLITFNYTLNSADAAIIRNAVKINVFDSLNLWDYKKLPIAGFSYKMGSGVNEVVFNNTSLNADNYLWDFGDGTTSVANSPTHSYSSNGVFTVSLTASTCDLQGVHSSIKDTIISFCSHTPSVLQDTLMLCHNASDTIWTQAGSSYQWLENGIPIPGATNQYLVVSTSFSSVDFPSPSVLTTNAGCSELSKQSFVGAHGWMGMVIIGFNTVGNVINGDSVCIGDTLKLVTSFYENHITQWYKNGIAIPFANSDTLTVTDSGTYKLKITHPMCSDISGYSESLPYEFITCIVGIVENSQPIFEAIYPSPATEMLTIKFRDNIINDQIQIFNPLGVLIKAINVSGSTKINISDLTNGLYFIRLKNNQQQTLKFIKQ